MAISIKELLSSDTISEFKEKINFNFDQLLLNGGGPAGPIGVQGPLGPMGSRGIRGSIWFEDSTPNPGTSPVGQSFTDLQENDLYLQSNGQVWEFDGTDWINSEINLKGATGATGASAGLSYFGSDGSSITRNIPEVIYPSPIIAAGMTNDDGVPTMSVGTSITLDNLPAGANNLTRLSNDLAEAIDLTTVSLFIRQINSSARSIIFNGGDTSENYEALDIDKLVNVTLLPDDAFQLNIPKKSTASGSSLIGLNINTDFTGQLYKSGRGIKFSAGEYSGTLTAPYSGNSNNIADILFEIQNGATLESDPKISFDVKFTGVTSSIILGNTGTLPTTTTKTGNILLDAANIRLVGAADIRAYANSILLTGSSSVSVVSSSSVSLNSPVINVGTSTTAIRVRTDANNSIQTKGKLTWGATSYQNPTADNQWYLNGSELGSAASVNNALIKVLNNAAEGSYLATFESRGDAINIYGNKINIKTSTNITKFLADHDRVYTQDTRLQTGKTLQHDADGLHFSLSNGTGGWSWDSGNVGYDLQINKSYVDIFIGQDFLPATTPASSYNGIFNLDIPNGSQQGQVLYLRVTALPAWFQLTEGEVTTTYQYIPQVNVRMRTYDTSYSNVLSEIASLQTTLALPSTPRGAEAFIHAIWTSVDRSSIYSGGTITAPGYWRIVNTTEIDGLRYNT